MYSAGITVLTHGNAVHLLNVLPVGLKHIFQGDITQGGNLGSYMNDLPWLRSHFHALLEINYLNISYACLLKIKNASVHTFAMKVAHLSLLVNIIEVQS